MQYFGTIICIDKIKTYEEINSLQSKVDSLEISEKVAKNDAKYYKKEYEKVKDKAAFMDWAVVIVPAYSSTYHKYGCQYLDKSDGYYVFNPGTAEAQGYRACKHCN